MNNAIQGAVFKRYSFFWDFTAVVL